MTIFLKEDSLHYVFKSIKLLRVCHTTRDTHRDHYVATPYTSTKVMVSRNLWMGKDNEVRATKEMEEILDFEPRRGRKFIAYEQKCTSRELLSSSTIVVRKRTRSTQKVH